MADTTYMKSPVEEYVRGVLAGEYGIAFQPAKVTLTTGGVHEFDAVSEDHQIIAAIKSSGRNRRGRGEAGKVRAAITDLYFLRLTPARTRLLILTDPDFHDFLAKELRGKTVAEVALKLVLLPAEMQAEVARIQGAASEEVSPAAGSGD